MENEIRKKVRTHYGAIAKAIGEGTKTSCCETSTSSRGCGCGSSKKSAELFGDVNYTEQELNNLPPEAVEASLGCSNPLVFAKLKPGETVLDLGSGAGIDALLSSRYVGENGKVYGLDMTDEMLSLANQNKLKMNVKNVDFLKGYVEDIPLKDGIVDAIVSNCVINLSGEKNKVFSEAYRVLKPEGRVAIADIVRLKDVPEEILQNVGLWSSCISGALMITDYKKMLAEAGFKNIEIETISVYTKEIINDMMPKSKKAKTLGISPIHDDSFWDLIDGAFASAHVKATK
jgi:ubiquinone/menaquinone biosynthesis C-methylase UbiE